jgi:hypothetical protein
MACRESHVTTCGRYIARTGTEQLCKRAPLLEAGDTSTEVQSVPPAIATATPIVPIATGPIVPIAIATVATTPIAPIATTPIVNRI